MYNSHVIGTCSICGGPVCVPTVWMSVIPPVPTCQHCGAVMASAYGPKIDMVKPPTTFTTRCTDHTGKW